VTNDSKGGLEDSKRLALIVEYQGTNYSGFQIQSEKFTIQGEIQKALAKFLGEHIKTQGAGRTDSGVHANGQVVAFDTCSNYPPEVFVNALNAFLPNDIRVLAGFPVNPGFNVRSQATSRQYQYLILNRVYPSAIWRNFAYQFSIKLDHITMGKAAKLLEGSYVVAPFVSQKGFRTEKTDQTIIRSTLTKKNQLITFEIEADRFYYHQIRRTVGALLQVGAGKLSEERFINIAKGLSGGSMIHGLPAQGLYLSKVSYEGSQLGMYLEAVIKDKKWPK